MVCCALLSLLIGSFLWVFKEKNYTDLQTKSDPLGWRLFHPELVSLSRLDEKQFSIRSRLKSFSFAANGLNLMLRTEHNCWIHLSATVSVFVVSLALQISIADWRWIIFSISIVWITEAINTALEYLCDVISPRLNPSIKASKDIAAGAVLISSITAVLLGFLTLAPYLETSFSAIANNVLFICKAFQ
ncbi:MAG: hypothetical protein DHS20C07_23660 [Methyloligella sp.]|nr:MAG: hypothetical protein DHS20C07_23660 [Methyloligella sp.]